VIILATTLLVIGLILLLFSLRQRKSSGLPTGKVIYSDTNQWEPLETPLYDPSLGLAGRPDYLVRHESQIVPVEIKSSQVSDAPYEGHVMQVAAYCRLIDTEFGIRPDHGLINYPGATFSIEYTHELEGNLTDLLKEIRTQTSQTIPNRSHQSHNRCRNCGYRRICDQALEH
jgi:CRISPR-associated exonuclease Cas4